LRRGGRRGGRCTGNGQGPRRHRLNGGEAVWACEGLRMHPLARGAAPVFMQMPRRGVAGAAGACFSSSCRASTRMRCLPHGFLMRCRGYEAQAGPKTCGCAGNTLLPASLNAFAHSLTSSVVATCMRSARRCGRVLLPPLRAPHGAARETCGERNALRAGSSGAAEQRALCCTRA
jgi:hypothetical protein